MARQHLNVLGMKTTRDASKPTGFVLFFLTVIQFFLYVATFVAKDLFGGDLIKNILHWFFLGWNAYIVYLITKTRNVIREKYNIPEGCCGEDFLTGCFYCCTIGQMARQTGDYPNYGSSCCSFTGLNREDKVDQKLIYCKGEYCDSEPDIPCGDGNEQDIECGVKKPDTPPEPDIPCGVTAPNNSGSFKEPDIPCGGTEPNSGSFKEPDIPCGGTEPNSGSFKEPDIPCGGTEPNSGSFKEPDIPCGGTEPNSGSFKEPDIPCGGTEPNSLCSSKVPDNPAGEKEPDIQVDGSIELDIDGKEESSIPVVAKTEKNKEKDP